MRVGIGSSLVLLLGVAAPVLATISWPQSGSAALPGGWSFANGTAINPGTGYVIVLNVAGARIEGFGPIAFSPSGYGGGFCVLLGAGWGISLLLKTSTGLVSAGLTLDRQGFGLSAGGQSAHAAWEMGAEWGCAGVLAFPDSVSMYMFDGSIRASASLALRNVSGLPTPASAHVVASGAGLPYGLAVVAMYFEETLCTVPHCTQCSIRGCTACEEGYMLDYDNGWCIAKECLIDSKTSATCLRSSSSSGCQWCELNQSCASSACTCEQQSVLSCSALPACKWCSTTCLTNADYYSKCSCSRFATQDVCAVPCVWCPGQGKCLESSAECKDSCAALKDHAPCAASPNCTWCSVNSVCTKDPEKCMACDVAGHRRTFCEVNYDTCYWDDQGGECLKKLNSGDDVRTIVGATVGSVLGAALVAGVIIAIAAVKLRSKGSSRYDPFANVELAYGATSSGPPDFTEIGTISQDGLTVSAGKMLVGSHQHPVIVGMEISTNLKVTNKSAGPVHLDLSSNAAPQFNLASPAAVDIEPGQQTLVPLTLSALFSTSRTKIDLTLAQSGDSAAPIVVELTVLVAPSLALDPEDIKTFECIGAGGSANIFRGTWKGATVAVKQMSWFQGDVSESEVRNEVALLGSLRSPFIIGFFGSANPKPDLTYIVLEYATLAAVLKQQTLKEKFKVKIALDCVQGMSFLHNAGIMHRDLKPENLLIVSLNHLSPVCAKVTDFGISKAASSGVSGGHTKGLGTPFYMAPEILSGSDYGPKADVFSFAVILWALATQREPYADQKFSSLTAVLGFISAGKRLSLPQHPFSPIISRCWVEEAESRPSFESLLPEFQAMLS
eukprot:m51a1_g9558 putative tyrosine (839) ;mRNA; f:894376-897964